MPSTCCPRQAIWTSFQCEDWNAYIINNKEVVIEMVLIVSKGYDEDTLDETSLMRHKIDKLPAKSFAKVELMQEAVLKLSNFFNVTFFEGNKMFDKKWIVPYWESKYGGGGLNPKQNNILNN